MKVKPLLHTLASLLLCAVFGLLAHADEANDDGHEEEESVLQAPNSAPIPRAVNLQADGELSGRVGVPVMLVVTQRFCSYCEQLKSEVVRPMIFSGEYVDMVIIRELRVDDHDAVIDFDGKPRDAAEIAARYKAWVTPTLLFLGPGGIQRSEAIKGYNTPGMFSYYVDEAIAEASRKIAKPGS